VKAFISARARVAVERVDAHWREHAEERNLFAREFLGDRAARVHRDAWVAFPDRAPTGAEASSATEVAMPRLLRGRRAREDGPRPSRVGRQARAAAKAVTRHTASQASSMNWRGVVFWIWSLFAAGQTAWLLFDGARTLAELFGTSWFSAPLVEWLRVLGALYFCTAGLAQRWIVHARFPVAIGTPSAA
jgi:hypothetical protein